MRVVAPVLTLAMLMTSVVAAQRPAAAVDFVPVERVVERLMSANGVPGAAVAIVRGDSVLYARGFGVASAESREPVTADMLFQVGSTSKMFTAAVVSILAGEGVLDLRREIGAHITGLDPALARLDAHHLLSQSAGLRDEPGNYGLQEESGLGTLARTWTGSHAILPQGTVFSYSNAGYALAGLLAESAARRPFADLVRERLFTPLGMTRSTYRPLEALTYPAAVGHAPPPDRPPDAPAAVVRPYANNTGLWPAGFAYTSASELARLVIALLNQGRIDGRMAIPQAVVRHMFTRHIAVPNVFERAGYGYGLFLGPYRGLESAWHDGQMPGFGAMVRMIPARREAVIVLLNRSNVRSDPVVDAAFDVLGVVAPAAAVNAAPELSLRASDMAPLVGRYENRLVVELFERDGALYRRFGGQEQRVYRIGPNRYTVDPQRRARPMEFDIVPAANGRPAYVTLFLWALSRQP
jgi:CubicO group peptidase (beta-lactamase class C family)